MKELNSCHAGVVASSDRPFSSYIGSYYLERQRQERGLPESQIKSIHCAEEGSAIVLAYPFPCGGSRGGALGARHPPWLQKKIFCLKDSTTKTNLKS